MFKIKITFFNLFLICINCYAQNSKTFIHFKDFEFIYRGINNQVELGVVCDLKHRIAFKGVELITDTIFYNESNGQLNKILKYSLITIDKEQYGSVIFFDSITNDTIGVHKFRILNLPDPTLFWGNSMNFEEANIKDKRLFAKYPSDLQVEAYFSIIDWNIKVNNKSISGQGNNLSNAEQELRNVKKSTFVEIEVNVVGPDKLTRKVKGIWKVKPWSEEKERKSELINCPR